MLRHRPLSGKPFPVSLVVTVLIFAFTLSVLAQTTPDSLLGEWVGDWKATWSPYPSGQYFMTVEKVDGEKVYGKIETVGSNRPPADFEGTVEGNVLKFSYVNKEVSGSFDIAGDKMTGSTVRAGFTPKVNVSLAKKK
jgi:hypothetical protein